VAIIGRETQDADTKIDFWCIDDSGTQSCGTEKSG
jgi:hypothetical protein